MDRRQVEQWLDGYVRAWQSNDPEAIGGLFADDALYYTAPFRQPWVRRNRIVEEWTERKDEPGTWEFRSEVLGVDGDLAFVRGWTHYLPSSDEAEQDYSNLWVIRLTSDGRCSEFVEWWMEHS